MKSLNIEQIEFLQLTNADNSTRSIAEKAIALGKRIDGRRLTQMRNIKVEELGTSGNVFVSLGNTVVFAAIAAEIVDPNLEHPTEGILLFNLELSPMCSTSYEPGKQMEQEQELSYALEKIYKEAGVIDVESLCIVAAKHVWCLRVNVHILQNDGNLLDACNIAVLGAFLTFRKPETLVNGDGRQLVEVDANYSSPLKIYHTPITVSLGILANQGDIVVDTNALEEPIVTTHISLLFNRFGDLFAIHKRGGDGVPLSKINEVIEVGKMAALSLHESFTNQMGIAT